MNTHAFGSLRGGIFTPLVLLFLLFCHGGGRRIVKPHMDRAAVKTIKAEYGDVFDCVDIYRQPAFDNPLLKNHTIQLRPSFEPKETISVLSSTTEDPPTATAEFWPMSESCPDGTVPILRIPRKTNSPRVPTLLINFGINYTTANSNKYDPNQVMMALGGAVGNHLHGTRVQINVWNPTVVGKDDYTTSQVWLVNGDNPSASIEAGWLVHPSFFGDKLTRFFIRWSENSQLAEGCINHECRGFVQTNRKYYLGSRLRGISVYGGKQFYISVHVYQDKKSGNWWVQCQDVVFGYWPRSLFRGLTAGADTIGWGGWVSKNDTATQMGSGRLPQEGYGKASYISNIKIVDESYSLVEPTEAFIDGGKGGCYEVRLKGNRGTPMQFHLFYGGPGENPK